MKEINVLIDQMNKMDILKKRNSTISFCKSFKEHSEQTLRAHFLFRLQIVRLLNYHNSELTFKHTQFEVSIALNINRNSNQFLKTYNNFD